jgi:carboxyl-terminal processing protease
MQFAARGPISCLIFLLSLNLSIPCFGAGQFSKTDRQFAQIMLRDTAADIQKHYYDPKLHGVDWDARVRQAKENIDKADTMDIAISEIAALVDTLNDSHTTFDPPSRNYIHHYGFEMNMVGNHCFVIHVTAGSDADKKGLKVGDEILSVNGHAITRENLWRIEYIYNTLRPQPGLKLSRIAVDGQRDELEVLAKIHPSPVLKYYLQQGVNERVRSWDASRYYNRVRYYSKGDDLLVVRLPEFDLSPDDVDNVLTKMRAHKGVVLDLRGNPGGFKITLERLIGSFFEKDLKIFDRVQRTETKPDIVAGRRHGAYTGRLTVLIDSQSASASELFAKVIQLEKRGFILGDRSAGAVMEAKYYSHNFTYIYGTEITDADLVMADGTSLEHVGVEPDFLVLPSASDLASHRDPALAKAAGLVGAKISPEEAGAIFPEEEPKDE